VNRCCKLQNAVSVAAAASDSGKHMSLVALELPLDVAVDLQHKRVIGAGGPTPGKPDVNECLLSDLEWPAVEAQLASRKVPFKVQLPGSAERSPFNSPTW
jgi:hypothetical protein